MRKLLGVLLAVLVVVGWGPPVSAAPVLNDWMTNVDGVTLDQPALGAAFDPLTGLGSVNFTVSGAGAHFVGLFLDQDTDLFAFATGDTGAAVGVPSAGLSWEIGSPWDYAVSPAVPGPIATHFAGSGLMNMVDPDILPPFPLGGDVSMALGWNFMLAADETAYIDFMIREVAPVSGFYLKQSNLDPGTIPEEIFFSASLRIAGGPPGVPEPGTLLLMGSGLLGLMGVGRRMHRKG